MDDLPALPILEVSRLLGLPEELIVNILSRINSDDLARCRAVSKAFPDICTEVLTKVRSVNLLCSLDRYTNPRRRPTPFKKIVTDLISSMEDVDSISIGVEERANHKSLDKKLDDLHLTEESFVGPLLKKVRGGLASLSISDDRMHSHGQWSWVLFLISMFCNNLHELVLKNAWLTTDGLNAMSKLTSLTLAFVKLDDKDLSTVNSCCPSLQILKLIMVEGLEKPQIDYLHLRTCQYVGFSSATLPLKYVSLLSRYVHSSAPLPLINAPNLTRLEVGFGPQIDKIVSYKVDLGAAVLLAPVSIAENALCVLFPNLWWKLVRVPAIPKRFAWR